MTEKVPFTDLISKVIDNRGKTCPTAEQGFPLIATNCVKNETLYPVFDKVRYVSGETFRTWFRGHPQAGDLIFVTKGSPGQVCLAPNPVNFCIAQDMVAIRANETKVYPPYLFAALRSPQVQAEIANMHVGTLIPHFKKGDFDKLKIPLPSRKQQIAAGDFYSITSQKIELNRRMNETLEAMAQAIFRDWFVDFGPTRRKLEGATDPVTIIGGLVRDAERAQAVADLFPAALGDDGLPEGWDAGVLGDLAFSAGTTVGPASISGDTPYVGLEHMPRKSIALNEWETASTVTSTKSKFEVGQILFGKLRPYFHKVGIAPIDGVCSTDIIVLDSKASKDRPLLTAIASSDEFVKFTDQGSTGTKMPRTSWGNMKSYPLTVAPEAVRHEYGTFTEPMLAKIIAGIHENRTLVLTRDLLLPKLMSGDIRLEGVEAGA
ncbi:hypothetical protein HFO26_36270 [Rhizobium leguminosarum]|uniref:restriction endonuclease subunit S n=1 Tax=Rhizobium leguminosarum TaxID=384 RepID=UPI001C95AD71|nr:restriction endonuclease subunit S [Rhizobium leguminosarum]MBY5735604.1 hypothetical protein [Rhizobium leguminosarum]